MANQLAVANMAEGSGVANAGGAAAGEPNAAQAAPQSTTASIIKSLLVRFVIIYFISSLFRGKQQPASPSSPLSSAPSKPSSNLFPNGTVMDLYVYVSEREDIPNFNIASELVWKLESITYGDWTAGPTGDSTFETRTAIIPSETVKNNGSLFVHVYLVKEGTTPFPSDKMASVFKVHKVKQLNRYKKRRYKKMHNLLTGETTASKDTIEKVEANITEEIISHWHPNLTINVIDDHTPWVRGSVPPPLDEFITFEPTTGKYYPVVYFNDYWNLMRDYSPINSTVDKLELFLTFKPLSMFRWQLYTAQSMRSRWTSFLGSDVMQESDEEQDSVKEAFLETSPYLLALTVIVSITHSVFEFLAFKNDIQFWKDRKSVEGISVRSVFFNVFQSVIVLLYVIDNDTNMVIRISVGIGLLIELWKIQKVTDVSLNREQKMFGFLPRIQIKDKGSYVESSTKEYDMLAFRYLSWALFPLLAAYAAYSLIYLEHKGFYSWILSMLYGFLLTFGFIMMTPQLFINYKLKSVAHLPWRMLTYKFLNTFIDDIFAFVIKMPTMYRLGCFRDDIIFLIYLYQRYIYPTDIERVNEFGVSGADLMRANQLQPSGEEPEAATDKKND